MGMLKLKPACKDYLWGGNRLIQEYQIEQTGDVLAEAWVLACHKDGASLITNGLYSGKTLAEYLDIKGKQILGTNCERFDDFPILTKLIDAADSLSIQVHPDDAYASEKEGQYGKTEMWYIVDAGKDAFLYYGFNKEVSEEELRQRIENDTLLEVLNAVPVKKGDCFFIEPGTIHAIGKNILIAEIQQNSNVTYRVYDYGRVGADGKKRELHVDKAIDVIHRVPSVAIQQGFPYLADCQYFTVGKLQLDGNFVSEANGIVSKESFLSVLILDGEGEIICGDEILAYKKGDSFFLEADSGAYTIKGSCEALVSAIVNNRRRIL